MSEAQEIPPASFAILVSTITSQAAVALGQLPMPGEEETTVNLPLAKHMIDTIEILQQKTEGNLDEVESKLLEQSLHQLRMMYVDAQRN